MSETAEAVMKSARVLGLAHGLSAQEMNHALKQAGLLYGEPGAYGLTEKGARFAAEQYHQRGTGGYSWYNPSWETRTWDGAVVGELDLSEAAKRQIRQAVSDRRLATRAARDAAAVIPAASDNAAAARTVDTEALARVMLPLLAVAVAYGLHKAVPLVRRRWKERAGAPEQARDRSDRGAPPEGLK